MQSVISPAPPGVLSFSSADPSGGAGVQGDAQTFAALGCHPMSVICAVSVRDTRSTDDCLVLDDDSVVVQARTILEDVPVRAFRLGVVGSVENLVAIAEILSDYPEVPVVLEPLLSQLVGGEDGAGEELAEAMVELILPQTTVLVSDRLELARLLAAGVDEEDEQDESDEPSDLAGLLMLGTEFVLVTDAGGHGPQCVNVLHGSQGVVRTDAWERLPGQHVGARATLAAAIAACLARGMAVPEAVREAQAYTWRALAAAYRPGMGPALPDRLCDLRGAAAR